MTFKRALYKVHLWAGLCLAVFLLLQGLTGLAISFRDELNRWLHPTVQESAARRLVLDEMTALIAARFPSFQIERAVLPETAVDPVWFRLTVSEGAIAPYFVLVDPYSGRVLEHGGIGAFPCELALFLHANLLAGLPGQFVVGAMGLGLLALGITGIVLWWPGVRNIANRLRVRRGRAGAIVLLDLHTLIGAYAVVGFCALAFTGALVALRPFLAIASTASVVEYGQTRHAVAARTMTSTGRDRIPGESVVAWANQLVSGTAVSAAFFEMRDGAPTLSSLLLQGRALPHARAYHEVRINAAQPGVVELARFEDQPRASRALEWMLPIHSGEVFGMIGRVFMALFGAGLVAVVVTGLWMWFLREKMRRKRLQPRPP